MSTYIELDSNVFFAFLESKGFVKHITHGNEVVYERRHDRKLELIIRCYTGIRMSDGVSRGCGEDAIRVVAILDTGAKIYPIYKGSRVYRTTSQESVQERTLERLRDAYKRCNEWLRERNKR